MATSGEHGSRRPTPKELQGLRSLEESLWRLVGRSPEGSRGDLDHLDEAVRRGRLALENRTIALAAGAALGEILRRELHMTWRRFTSPGMRPELGLRLEVGGEIQEAAAFPFSMIEKRRSGPLAFRELFDAVERSLDEWARPAGIDRREVDRSWTELGARLVAEVDRGRDPEAVTRAAFTGLEQLLTRLGEAAGVRDAFVVDREGQLVAAIGDFGARDELPEGTAAASISLVGQRAILTVVLPQGTQPVVAHVHRAAAQSWMARLLESLDRAHRAGRATARLEELSDADLDRLFEDDG